MLVRSIYRGIRSEFGRNVFGYGCRSSRGISTNALGINMDELPKLHPSLLKRAETLRVELEDLETKITSGTFDQETNVKFSTISSILEEFAKYENYRENVASIIEMLNEENGNDQEIIDDCVSELKEYIPKLISATSKVQVKLIPKVSNYDKPTIMELRPGVGGSEAQIFTNDLLSMYINFANTKRWGWEIISKTEGTLGGLTEAILSVNEPGSYDVLRHESGVHRVQRVPATETKGRTHTSTAAVVVLPKLSEGNESSLLEDERQFAPGEIRIDTMRSGGKGGQHVNTTDSAVRLTHIPTGIQVQQQDERSQPRNKAKAFSILRSRLAALDREREIAEQKSLRTTQVSTTDRSDKIRTYNYSQNRVTDHRCGFSLHDLEGCLSGEKLEDIIEAVEQEEVRERIESL
ncbi:peptide chain release factor 1, mitochondrial [[Candida] railenensis]|uniref:Peptide chain release factor 1, mitochondrial n=1 Tax=[Candida] railenensis TaxID=45579 RepID=A0A9P0VZD5_9ASCO|nr:peptide chain release factor 1, mitochondrial [[Candida] railenensis]